MANTTDKSILTTAGKALLAQLNAEEKPLIIDKMIFANVPNRPEFPQPDDVVPTDHVVHQEGVEQRGRLSADSVIYSTTLTSDVGPFEFNWTGAYCSEYGVLVTIDHHALTPKSADEPGVAGNTLVRSVVLEYKDIAEITNITVDASSWQYNATPRMKKMDDDVAQAIIDQNGKDWFIEDGFLVTPQASAFNIKAGAGYVSGNRVTLEFDRNVQVPNKPSFIYVDAHREGTPTGEQVTLFDFVITADEKDDYTDANGVKHFVCKIAQVLGDGSVSDLRPEGESASRDWVENETKYNSQAERRNKQLRVYRDNLEGSVLNEHNAIYIIDRFRDNDKLFSLHKTTSGVIQSVDFDEFEAVLDDGSVVYLSPDTPELCYKQFANDRVVDEIVDWFPIIKVTHKIANAFNKAVSPSKHIYNIGLLPDEIGAEIETNCDFSECQFRLTKDTAPEEQYGRRRLFSCVSEKLASLEPGQFDISDFKEDALDLPSIAALGYYNVVLVIHSNDRMLLRYGDVNQPIYQKEACALFESGTLASPLTFTYSNITKIDIYPIETKRLGIKNIQFLLEDDFKSCVGLYAQRNNIDVYGINVEEPDNVNKGYSRNFVCLYETYNCELEFQQGNGFDSGGGTYLLRPELTESCKIKNVNALNGWGVFGGNYNKNIKFIDCETNRIDQHAIGRDCLMERCKIYSNMGISLAGKGRLTARDCQHFVRANGANFITLRPDYASYWDGPIIVESLEVVIECISVDEFNYSIVDASIDTADYGIDHILGTSVVVDGVTVKTDGSFEALVTVYNAPNNVGVNNQYLPTLISAKNMSSEQSNVRFRVLPTIVADQPKYKGGATTIIAEGIINDHAWVHSSKFNVERDALVRMVGANYATGQPHEFICHVRNCPNSSYVWTLPSELRINGVSKVAALLTDAGNGSGTSFPGVENAIHVSDSSIELMNYRGSQDFMLESVNMRSVRVIKPSYNSEVGHYRSLDLSKVESALGVVFDTDVPVIDGQETKVQEFFTGLKSAIWK